MGGRGIDEPGHEAGLARSAMTADVKKQRGRRPAGSRLERMSRVKRVVVKIGSSSVAGTANKLDGRLIGRLVNDVVELREGGTEVAIVSSGAVAAGMGRLEIAQRPRSIAELQATAAVGQNLLMGAYEGFFRRRKVPVGQVLLTAEDILENRQRYVNLRNTFRQLFAYGVVPVINENDSVAVAELKRSIGENDMLAAYVANLVHAELLVVLSDVEGLYSEYGAGGPMGEVIGEVGADDANIDRVIGRSNSKMGSGGMATKLTAARLLMACGEMTVIAHARKHSLKQILAGEEVGTLFSPSRKRLGSRKRWIGYASPARGSLVVDRGAERAIRERGKSLLPVGVVLCRGEFSAGDVVSIESCNNAEVARGLSRYASEDIERIRGRNLAQVEQILGRPALEVIHRDDLVVTAGAFV